MPKKLLLADDSVVIQKLVGLSFANEDVEIVSTDNGDDAVTLAQEIRPDVVLADVVMPGKSGYEVCEAIKQDPAIGQTPVLLLTGTFEAFDEARAASAGADGQITKPFEAQALVERVTGVMSAPRAAAASIPAQPRTAPPSPAREAMPDPERTVVASTPGRHSDLFDKDISTLSPPTASDAPHGAAPEASGLDSTPDFLAAEGQDLTASALFGAPGEGATDQLDESGGELALGQSVAPERSEPDSATIAKKDVRDDSASESEPVAVDLHTALGSLPSDLASGLAVGEDDINASTSPSLDEPMDFDLEEERPSALERVMGSGPADSSGNLTVHVPSSNIDADRSEAPMPPAVEAPRPVHDQPTVVADLDAALSSPSSSAADDRLAVPTTRATDDDLDFAFDVSEQMEVPDTTDPLSDSFSSLMDISEASILGRSSSDSAPSLSSDEDLAVGYDVSSSDLATAEPAIPEVPQTLPVPELEPMTEVPQLPEARMADRAEDRIEDAPDAIEEVEAEHTYSDAVSADSATTDQPPAAIRDPGVGIGAPASEPPIFVSSPPPASEPPIFVSSSPPASFEGEARETPAAPEKTATDAPVIEMPEDTLASGAGTHPATGADPVAGAGEDVRVVSDAGRGERRVADLSPLMEQRIQESLEKAAWEAFSDLSETVVKQVLDRVEQIAWEVIPQMAETLVREEIRKMKGEDD